jgi:hypothetical protein
MKRYGLMLAVLVLSAAVSVASASASGTAQTMSLLAVDNGKGQPINGFMFQRAPAAGDQFAISEDLYTWAGTKRGAKVGSDLGVATFLTASRNGGSNMFAVQANLKGGTILVGGVVRVTSGPSNFTLAITGGTGKYANVRGTVNVRQLPGNKTSLAFHLQP